MRYPNVTGCGNLGWGNCTPKDHERGKILSAVADDAYITSVPNVHFLAQKISEINRQY